MNDSLRAGEMITLEPFRSKSISDVRLYLISQYLCATLGVCVWQTVHWAWACRQWTTPGSCWSPLILRPTWCCWRQFDPCTDLKGFHISAWCLTAWTGYLGAALHCQACTQLWHDIVDRGCFFASKGVWQLCFWGLLFLGAICQSPLWRSSNRGVCGSAYMHRWWLATPIQCLHSESQHPSGIFRWRLLTCHVEVGRCPDWFTYVCLDCDWEISGSTVRGLYGPWRWVILASRTQCLCWPSKKLDFSLIIP